MTNFEQVKQNAKKVFFNRKNWYKSDFMYDFGNDKLIPMSYYDTSHGDVISLSEYSSVFNDCTIPNLMFSLQELTYHTTEKQQKATLIVLKKEFDEWFDKFYHNIYNYANEHCIISVVGAYISYDHIAYLEKHKDEEDSPLY